MRTREDWGLLVHRACLKSGTQPRPGCSHTPRGLLGYIPANEIPSLLRAIRTGFSHNQKRPNQHKKFQRSAGRWKKERLCSDFLLFFCHLPPCRRSRPHSGHRPPRCTLSSRTRLSCWPLAPADLLSSSRGGAVSCSLWVPDTLHTAHSLRLATAC